MGSLIIDREKCFGCGRCHKSCIYDGIKLQEGKAEVTNSCTLCGICIDFCPINAIRIMNDKEANDDLSMYRDIWIFGETENGKLLPVVFELISKARELSNVRSCDVKVLIIGSKPSNLNEVYQYGVDEFIFYKIDSYEKTEETDIEIFDDAIRSYHPEIILYGATTYGRSIAPRVAARVRTGLTADCTQLEIDADNVLQQTRPAFGGNLMATIVCSHTRPQMATVRAGVFLPKKVDSENHKFTKKEISINTQKAIKIIQQSKKDEIKNISEADIILSVGRGIGSQKNLLAAEKLANLMGAQLGVSRPLVDIGWKERTCQIGQTGYNISPKLLIAIGISGAVQHLAGITNAGTIIAINSDPDASIFNIADYKIVGDSKEVIDEMILQIENAHS